MVHEVQGVIAREKGAPVEVTTILVPDPGPGEALVRVQACGVCHTDLHYREGGINDEFPFLLGHEAAGIVEAVGPDVSSVALGDFVILNWRAVCGECRSCRRGRPQYCFDTHNATQKMTLADGTVLAPALGIGAFSEKTIVAPASAQRLTLVPGQKPPACSAAGSWRAWVHRCSPARSVSGTRLRSSAAAGSAARQLRARASLEPRRSSAWTSTLANWRSRCSSERPTQ